MANTFTVERSVTIDAPPPLVYEQIADFRAWTDWSPWEGYDPTMSRRYTGPESGPGSAYAWSGNSKAGRGQMTIVDATKPSQVLIDLVFEKPFKSRNAIRFTIAPQDGGSRVTWRMVGPRTLATRVMGVVKSMDAMIGPDFERGLSRLKATTEERAAP